MSWSCCRGTRIHLLWGWSATNKKKSWWSHGSPHTHYDRSVFSPHLLHTRGAKCCKTKDEIIKNITLHLPTDWLEENGYGTENLHNYKTCLCDRETNKWKKKKYYQTPEGIATKKRCNERSSVKRKLIDAIITMTLDKKAELNREIIIKLMNMLWYILLLL